MKGEVEFLEPFVLKMVELGASDLHWSEGEAPRLRVHGRLVPMGVPTYMAETSHADLTRRMLGEEDFISFVKTREYDGSATVSGNRRVRINVYWENDRISWAIRLLPNRFYTFEELGLPVPLLKELCQLHHGLVLVTGATGSGKTTTLASLIHEINLTRADHILTIEDPVEYIHSSSTALVSQREVGRDTESFHNALRSALREDPDVVLLGEMRDRVSMDAALTLSETGHLTFATLHTSGAAESISRLVSAFEPAEQLQVRERLAANLRCVITQQLVPWSDGTGRTLCAEILLSTKAVMASIRDQKERQLPSLIELGTELGMVTMNQSLLAMVRKHRIGLAEALRYSNDPESLRRMAS